MSIAARPNILKYVILVVPGHAASPLGYAEYADVARSYRAARRQPHFTTKTNARRAPYAHITPHRLPATIPLAAASSMVKKLAR